MTHHPWHTLSIPSIFETLQSRPQGLTQTEVQERSRRYGPNRLAQKKQDGWSTVLARQFVSPLILVLMVAALGSAFLAEWVNAGVIAAAVALNTLVGFIQEYKANQSLARLRSLVSPRAIVLREGMSREMDARELVPGDVLLLHTGDRITADARLLEAVELTVNESTLTGESLPERKQTQDLPDQTVLADRINMIFAGTSVLSGRGQAVVVATGSSTELGRIATLVQKTPESQTPLQQELKRLARWIAGLMIFLVVVLFVTGVVSGRSATEMFSVSIALAVAAIPEGLAVSVTVILAIGMQRILKRKSLVRKLVAAETLGSVSVLCADKTGTITEGQMRVTHLASGDEIYVIESLPASSETIAQMFLVMALCNDATGSADTQVRGTPTERALLDAYVNRKDDRDALLASHPRLGEVPFDSVKKYMMTAHAWGDGLRLFLKGASIPVLERCGTMALGGETVALTSARRTQIAQQEETLTRQGLRLIALASKTVSTRVNAITPEDQADFVFLGFVGLHDPLRADVKEQIEDARQAGVRTILITGDHPETARAIAAQAGLMMQNGSVVTGPELDAWSEEELKARVADVVIFARVEPRHKIRIVNAWQARGEVVAMTGDGVNDAPALKAADVGIAVGSGTEVAKQSSDIVILDNRLGTITAAIEEGRVIFDNIRKTTVYLLADSFTEIVLIGGSILMGLPIPLLPAQILWINLVADTLPNVGLTLEPGEKDIMRLPPRPRREAVLNKEMLTIIFVIGIVTDVVLFLLYLWLLQTGQSVETIRSILFAAVGIDSLLYVFAVKSFRQTIFRINPFSNPWLLCGVAVGFGLMALALIHPFFQSVFEIVPLTASAWGLLVLIGMMKLGAIELTKEFFLFRQTRRARL
ncbi:HAD-IC family P-type ATPase [Candidatus Uhrbacteria bacterium]|nr:HAD-IC family P-type ATPase [Candidatus Uhrbacteria bacterium]